jgi:hypothetical protein
VCEPCQKRDGSTGTCSWSTDRAIEVPQVPANQLKWLDNRIRALEDSYLQIQGMEESTSLLSSAIVRESLPEISVSPRPQPSRPLGFLAQPCTSSDPSANTLAPDSSRIQPNFHHENLTPAAGNRRSISAYTDNASPSDTNSVHAIIGTTADIDCTGGVFGSSSAGTFMQSVKRMFGQALNGSRHSTGYPGDSDPSQLPPMVPQQLPGRNLLDYVLPPRERADELMETYWKYVHVLYPYLDEPQMRGDYKKIWEGTRGVADERSFICLLNIIFALTCQIHSPLYPKERGNMAKVFYLRARGLLDVVEVASVRTVQSYLLLGQYFQSTNEPHPCWVFVGLGIRTAQSLGLNLPATSERVGDPRTSELLRRVWHGCVLMDRVLSMIYGRASMIGPQTGIAVPLPLSGENHRSPEVPNQHIVDSQRPSTVSFFVSSLMLYEILHDVLFNYYFRDVQQGQYKEELHNEYFGIAASRAHPSIFDLERRLLMWKSSVPIHLRLSSYINSDDRDVVLYRQAVILHQRYAYLRTCTFQVCLVELT